MAKTSRKEAKAPSAWVVAPKDRGRKSVKFDTKSDYMTKGKVYLNDGEEFQIELHNPLIECVLADIKLNGNSISKGGLVLRPGERFYLDCFIDDKKKFVFSTYEVEDTDEAMGSIAKNGLLEVFFFKESAKSIDRSRLSRVIVERHYYPYQQNNWWYTTPNVYCSNGSNIVGQTTFTTTDSNATYTSSSPHLTNINSENGTINLTSGSTPINTLNIETGRVEKGEKSDQKFDEVDMDFDNLHIASTVLELLPESRRPIETKELKEKPEPKKQVDSIEMIRKLADLRDAGILTEEEFSNKKSELLSRI